MTDRSTREPVTRAGDELLTDLIQDHEAPSYHVIERVRVGISAIEQETLAASHRRVMEAIENSWQDSGYIASARLSRAAHAAASAVLAALGGEEAGSGD